MYATKARNIIHRHHKYGWVLTLFAVVLVFGVYFRQDAINAASFTFTQNDWSTGVTANTATHTSNQLSWAEYDSLLNTTASSTVALTTETSGSLTGSIYNTEDATSRISSLTWTETGTTTEETIKFQVRTSPDNITWSEWCGMDDTGYTCTGSNYFTHEHNGVDIASTNPIRSGGNDQYVQYKTYLTSGGGLAPYPLDDDGTIAGAFGYGHMPATAPDYQSVSYTTIGNAGEGAAIAVPNTITAPDLIAPSAGKVGFGFTISTFPDENSAGFYLSLVQMSGGAPIRLFKIGIDRTAPATFDAKFFSGDLPEGPLDYSTTGTIINPKFGAVVDWDTSVVSYYYNGSYIGDAASAVLSSDGIIPVLSADDSDGAMPGPGFLYEGSLITNATDLATYGFPAGTKDIAGNTIGASGIATPTLSEISIAYAFNDPPDFDTSYGGGTGITAVQESEGEVTITYKVRDTDTLSASTTPGFINPTFEYSTNAGSSWASIPDADLILNATSTKAVGEVGYTTHITTWYATSTSASFDTAQAQIRITANDNEAAHNTTTATSESFTLDTTPPEEEVPEEPTPAPVPGTSAGTLTPSGELRNPPPVPVVIETPETPIELEVTPDPVVEEELSPVEEPKPITETTDTTSVEEVPEEPLEIVIPEPAPKVVTPVEETPSPAPSEPDPTPVLDENGSSFEPTPNTNITVIAPLSSTPTFTTFVTDSVVKGITTITDLPPVRTTINVTTRVVEDPVGAVVTKVAATAGVVSGTAIAATSLFLNPLALTELFLVPARLMGIILSALGIRKRTRRWGTVYDSVTKQPLDPAYVILKDKEGNEVGTGITDLDGRYGFLIGPGTYTIETNKTNYTFPSKKLAGKTRDVLYDDLYFGEELTLGKDGAVITKNIPLDPQGFDWNEFTKQDQKLMKFHSKRDTLFQAIATYTLFIGLPIAIAGYLVTPAPYNTIIVAVYALLFILRMFGLKPKSHGSLTDSEGNPLSYAIVRVHDVNQGGKEIFHRVADAQGRYYCLVQKGQYTITVEKKNPDESYSLVYTSPVIDAKKGVVNQNVRL